MLRIWGRTNSINVQKVLWTLDELGLDYAHTPAGREHGKLDEAWFADLNPNRLVPVIDDDGFVLWESNAIVGYLAAQYGKGRLCPSDERQRAEARQWMDWATTTVVAAMTPVFWGLVRTPPEQRDTAAIDKGIAACQAAFGLLDAKLEGRDYLLGETLTMADIPLGCAVYRWHALEVPRQSLPHLEAWYARLRDRPAYPSRVMLPLS
ncbi:glutathione S-transferase family protein [Algihabitans albus]|uniref:glutathione S-transferase family protein n=1 Tax=Algihabitans albus TaxID=2164067 RepID=UPI000E5D49CF|nr:glutathione S-transferase [Algihabitans albus]